MLVHGWNMWRPPCAHSRALGSSSCRQRLQCPHRERVRDPGRETANGQRHYFLRTQFVCRSRPSARNGSRYPLPSQAQSLTAAVGGLRPPRPSCESGTAAPHVAGYGIVTVRGIGPASDGIVRRISCLWRMFCKGRGALPGRPDPLCETPHVANSQHAKILLHKEVRRSAEIMLTERNMPGLASTESWAMTYGRRGEGRIPCLC